MKKIKYLILSGFAACLLLSCNDLTLQPKGILDESALFGNPGGVETYLAGVYMYLPIEEFNYNTTDGYYIPIASYSGGGAWNTWNATKWCQSNVSGESVGWSDNIQMASVGFGYWPYDQIRNINTLIEGLPKYKANYGDADYNSLMGEARFLRAFYYFGMAKRYGGVPIIDKVQDPGAPADSLNVFRATEYDTWMFIHDDLQFAMENMSATSELGRANKYVAAALMSRTMLYAATIAKYGSYTTGSPEPAAQKGYVGIPADKANYFFTEAYNACTFFDGSNYTLVDGADKVQNYVDLFLTNNAEDIFIEQYSASAPRNLERFHSYDATISPSPQFSSWAPGSQSYPTLDIVELFQKLPIQNADGTPTRYDTREQLWQDGNLEPRLLADVYFPGMTLRGASFDVRRGLYKTYTGTVADAQFGVATAPVNSATNRLVSGGPVFPIPAGWGVTGNVVGAHGAWAIWKPENHTQTGLFVRKYVDYNKTAAQSNIELSQQPWKVFRFAEILLNRAEAAYELGKTQEAYDLIARIRNRAGAAVWTPSASPATVYTINGQVVDENLQFIRDERARELLFENHRWWDLRRWRVADLVFNQFEPLGLMPYLITSENKYIFLPEYNMAQYRFTFNVRDYYEPIPGGEINKNNNLIQNPIY